MISWYVPQASTYAPRYRQPDPAHRRRRRCLVSRRRGDLLLADLPVPREAGVRGQYITGEEAHEKRWIADSALPGAGLRRDHRGGGAARLDDVKIDMPQPRGDGAHHRAAVGVDVRARRAGRQARHGRRHPDGRRAARAGRIGATTSSLQSKDVLHSFSVPVFRLKQDAVPGRIDHGLVQADRRPGRSTSSAPRSAASATA